MDYADALLQDLRELQPLWSSVENWAVRLFFFMGAITLFPWILLILFDAGMYVWRYLILAPVARALGMEAPGKMADMDSGDFGDHGEKEA